MAELGDDALVDLALERHDEVGKLAHLRPPPLDELRLVAAARMRDVDLGILPGEAQRVPFLLLAAVAAAPRVGNELVRQIVGEPFAQLRDELDRADVGLLAELAERRAERSLARIEPALRHLPGMDRVDLLGAAGAPPDEHAALAIEHHGSDARPIGQVLVGAHGRSHYAAVAAGIATRAINGIVGPGPRAGPGRASRSPLPGACRSCRQ